MSVRVTDPPRAPTAHGPGDAGAQSLINRRFNYSGPFSPQFFTVGRRAMPQLIQRDHFRWSGFVPPQ